MICKKCGNEVGTAKICPSCGTSAGTDLPSNSPIDQSLGDFASTSDFADEIESAFQAGDVISNRYEVISELGKGGMGSVYKVKDNKLNLMIALKSMHSKYVSNERALQRFNQELVLSRGLQHENIVGTYDIGDHEGIQFFTMEFIEGKTLQDLIEENKANNKKFSLEETVSVMEQVCSGLQYAHKKTVHRDIKPANIMMIENKGDNGANQGWHVKINDFGIAKMATSTSFTGEGLSMGTAYYMAPEQRTNAANVDARADVYSVGVVLYEMLTGDLPQGRFMLPGEIRSDLPKEIDVIVEKALHPDPAKRQQSAKELADELKSVYQKSLKVKEPSASGTAGTKHPDVNTGKDQKPSFQAKPETTETGSDESKSQTLLYAGIGVAVLIILIASIMFFKSGKTGVATVEGPKTTTKGGGTSTGEDDINQLISDAQNLFKNGKYVECIGKVDFVLNKDANNQNAIELQKKANVQIKLAKGSDLFDKKEYNQCVSIMDEILDRYDSANEEAKELKAKAQDKIKAKLATPPTGGGGSPEPPSKYKEIIRANLQIAKMSFNKGDYSNCIRLCDEILMLHKGNREANALKSAALKAR